MLAPFFFVAVGRGFAIMADEAASIEPGTACR